MIQGMGRKGREAGELRGNAPGPLLYHTLPNVGKDSDSGVRPARIWEPSLYAKGYIISHSYLSTDSKPQFPLV